MSFTDSDLAKGEVYYNYRMTKASIEELSGISVFFKDANGDVFHTYSSYGRGNEEVLGAYMYLDLTPKGRNENGPGHNLGDWVRHHDRYMGPAGSSILMAGISPPRSRIHVAIPSKTTSREENHDHGGTRSYQRS